MEEQMEESDRLQWEHDDLENIHERTRWKSMEFQCQDAYSDTETAAIKVTEYYDRAWRYQSFRQNIEDKSHYSEILQPQDEVLIP